LEKDRKLRLQAIGDAGRLLDEEPESAPCIRDLESGGAD
jgi:hypothetical protein